MEPRSSSYHRMAFRALLVIQAAASIASGAMLPPRLSAGFGGTIRSGGSRGPAPQQPPQRMLSAAERLRSADLMGSCTVKYRSTTLDHFSFAPPPGNVTTFQQRFFVCQRHWSERLNWPILFYAGNEADVTLYLNNSGLMWNAAAKLGAALVFAEHRFYGESLPYGPDEYLDHLEFLTAEQALADYAELLGEFKEDLGCQESAVVAFGGSYGGMLASWMRMKYPHVIDGAIASSAPIQAFEGMRPPYDTGSYAKVVTYDATKQAGASKSCRSDVRGAFETLLGSGGDRAGQDMISGAMGLCSRARVNSSDDALGLAYWLQSAMDYISMGNYPYETSYITNGGGVLPPFPMRVGCDFMESSRKEGSGGGGGRGAERRMGPLDVNDISSTEGLLTGLARFAAIFYNASGTLECLDWSHGTNPDTDLVASLWDYQSCTEMMMPMSRDGVSDMFWEQPWWQQGFIDGCKERFGVEPRPLWAATQWGGRKISASSNIVFANGEYDPWRGGGVLESPNPTILALDIPGAAHHLDLMFPDPSDSTEVQKARETQMEHIVRWIKEANKRTAGHQPMPSSRATE